MSSHHTTAALHLFSPSSHIASYFHVSLCFSPRSSHFPPHSLPAPAGKLINFKGFAVGDGFPACIPQPGKPIDWCVDLNNVEFFKYPNALPGPYWDVSGASASRLSSKRTLPPALSFPRSFSHPHLAQKAVV